MPDSLSPTLTEAERKDTATLLWQLVAMIDREAPKSNIREAAKHIAQKIEPFGARYQEESRG